jgi:hypothetical protein
MSRVNHRTVSRQTVILILGRRALPLSAQSAYPVTRLPSCGPACLGSPLVSWPPGSYLLRRQPVHRVANRQVD